MIKIRVGSNLQAVHGIDLDIEDSFQLKIDKEGIIWFTTDILTLYAFNPQTGRYLFYSLKGLTRL